MYHGPQGGSLLKEVMRAIFPLLGKVEGKRIAESNAVHKSSNLGERRDARAGRGDWGAAGFTGR